MSVTRLVRHNAIAFNNTLLNVTFHVEAPSCDVFGFDICACGDQLREQQLFFHHISAVDLCCPLSASKMYLISEWYLVVPIDFLLQFRPTTLACSEFSMLFLCRRHGLTRIIAVCDWHSLASEGFVPSFFNQNLLKCSPLRVQAGG